MANNPELEKINIYMKLFCHVTDKETRWVKDTAFKIWACYLAQKHTPYSDSVIAGFFNIYTPYMINQIENLSIELLVDPELKENMLCLEKALVALKNIHA